MRDTAEEEISEQEVQAEDVQEKRAELEGKIRRALMLKDGEHKAAELFENVKDMLELSELEELGKNLAVGKMPKNFAADNSAYMMRGL